MLSDSYHALVWVCVALRALRCFLADMALSLVLNLQQDLEAYLMLRDILTIMSGTSAMYHWVWCGVVCTVPGVPLARSSGHGASPSSDSVRYDDGYEGPG